MLGGPSEPQRTAGTFPQTHIPGQRWSEGFCSILRPKAQKQSGFSWQGEAHPNSVVWPAGQVNDGGLRI